MMCELFQMRTGKPPWEMSQAEIAEQAIGSHLMTDTMAEVRFEGLARAIRHGLALKLPKGRRRQLH
jgi:hypothetical protein